MFRPYVCPWYPFPPLVFCVGAGAIVIALCVCTPETSWPGFALVAAGGLLYIALRKFSRREKAEMPLTHPSPPLPAVSLGSV